MKTYYALWMPTKEKGFPKKRFKVGKKNLCDKFSLGGYYISASFDCNDNITLVYQVHKRLLPRSHKRQITLVCEEKNNRGFCIYSFDDTDCKKDGFTKSLTGNMNPSIYHYIKEAFHKHESHPATEDALLTPYVQDVAISFEKDEKTILLYYLNQYKEKFEGFYDYSIDEVEVAKAQINGYFNVNRGIRALAAVIDKGNSIKGEYTYYNFLRTTASQKAWIPKELKKSVDDTFRNIEQLLTNTTEAYNICTSSLGVRYGRWGIFFGVAGILVSAAGILFSIIHEPSPDSVNNHTDKTVERAISSVNDSIASLKKDIGNIKKKSDVNGINKSKSH